MSKNVTTVNRLFHAQRELKMIRRIGSLVFVLLTTGLSYSIFLVMSVFNSVPKYHFRIVYAFTSPALVFTQFALLQMAEPLKASLMKRIKGGQIDVLRTVT
ncbi:unnamed protein product [Rotaria magnacalcarata]|uniref:Uncharacterized protein n=1 Tax=Rotaria magnacalcarata TaxID=392030 RepID=A0A820B8H0_9BILA|nr:unnamed protein product [Rotaria magnacalcarata]CAF4203903.1 unnamed protein product [Rotaria magnacalcarata]